MYSFLEQTFKIALPWEFTLFLRTREDLRFIDSRFSARIRERATVERDVRIGGFKITPYGSAEIYYDTRHEAFSRHRFTVGAVFPLFEWLSADLYGARQTDRRPSTKHVNAAGLTFIFNF